MSHQPALETRQLAKAFGSIEAVADATLHIDRGECVGLIGENGAGKSTLLAMLGGFQTPDRGEISVAGSNQVFSGPRDAMRAGVGLVHQHLSVIPEFTVAEQLALSGWKSPDLPQVLVGRVAMTDRIADLSMGARQRVEIAKVLISRPDILLLDEPTSILAPPEVDDLFQTIRQLIAAGTAVVMVTHKLREVTQIADRLVVMRRGRIVLESARPSVGWSAIDEASILSAMIGEQSRGSGGPGRVRHRPSDNPLAMLSVHDLRADGIGTVTFDVRRGEIITIVGIDGQGQRELAEAISGYRSMTGSVTLNDLDVTHDNAETRADKGIALVSDDRLGEASIGAWSIASNVRLKRPGTIRDLHARTVRLLTEWRVSSLDPNLQFRSLSGGNMQRVLVGRELMRSPRLLVALNPTHGLDVPAAEAVSASIRSLCSQGASAVIFTTDIDEALDLGHRVFVIRDGSLSPPIEPLATNRSTIGQYMVFGC